MPRGSSQGRCKRLCRRPCMSLNFPRTTLPTQTSENKILRRLPGRKKPTASLISAAPVSSVACSLMTTLESDITNGEDLICPPPKRLRTRKTAPAAMRDPIEDIKQKRHLSTAHKEATRLFAQECAKPGGGGVNGQVAEQINKLYSVGLSAETIRQEVRKGHVGTSPMKMGPAGRVPHCDYRYLCDASIS
jgi:hypothetical protein